MGGLVPEGGSGPGGSCLVLGWGAWWRPPKTATAVGGTHPTGMHSCFLMSLQQTFMFYLCSTRVGVACTVASGSRNPPLLGCVPFAEILTIFK